MLRRNFLLSSLVLGLPQAAPALPVLQENRLWADFFSSADAQGSLVVLDARGKALELQGHDPVRAQQRFSPASTFKIPHSLFALDAGLVRDEFQVFAWDGVARPVPAWNGDQTLRSAMRNSTVWVFERFAKELGAAREAAYMQSIGYGNAAVSGAAPFWVEGDLAISCMEQLALLQRLYRNELPFALEHQRLVKDVMVNAAGAHWILRAKTGWSGRVAWWTGWIEWPEGPVFFAINIDTPQRQADLAKPQAIARAALRSIAALP